MAGPTYFSKQTLTGIREYLTTTTLRYIDTVFTNAGIGADLEHIPNVGGQRRTLVEQYYVTLNLQDWNDAMLLKRALEDILSSGNTSYSEWLPPVIKNLKKDGWEYEESSGSLRYVAKTRGLIQVGQIAEKMNADYLSTQVDRLHHAVNSDPEAAIGGAKELVETCCKTILDEHSVTYDPDWDVPKLTKETLKLLKLTPEDVPETARGKDAIKRLMQGLANTLGAMAEMRNEYGTGHGKAGTSKGPKPRHAALAVGAATTMATFLFETHILTCKK